MRITRSEIIVGCVYRSFPYYGLAIRAKERTGTTRDISWRFRPLGQCLRGVSDDRLELIVCLTIDRLLFPEVPWII